MSALLILLVLAALCIGLLRLDASTGQQAECDCRGEWYGPEDPQ